MWAWDFHQSKLHRCVQCELLKSKLHHRSLKLKFAGIYMEGVKTSFDLQSVLFLVSLRYYLKCAIFILTLKF